MLQNYSPDTLYSQICPEIDAFFGYLMLTGQCQQGYAGKNFFRVFPEICPEYLGSWGVVRMSVVLMYCQSNTCR